MSVEETKAAVAHGASRRFFRGLQHRVLEPELLDSLHQDHPDALESRSDIRFLNAVMGSFGWIKARLRERVTLQDQIVELGAGDGGLVSDVVSLAPDFARLWTGLDFAPQPQNLPAGVTWVKGDFFSDVIARHALQSGTVIVANLILHHFTEPQLRELAGTWTNARLIVVNEPARHRRHHWKGMLLDAVVGFNYVTMHDMALSIRAGFRLGELPEVLGLSRETWEWKERHTMLGSCQLVAWKKD